MSTCSAFCVFGRSPPIITHSSPEVIRNWNWQKKNPNSMPSVFQEQELSESIDQVLPHGFSVFLALLIVHSIFINNSYPKSPPWFLLFLKTILGFQYNKNCFLKNLWLGQTTACSILLPPASLTFNKASRTCLSSTPTVIYQLGCSSHLVGVLTSVRLGGGGAEEAY